MSILPTSTYFADLIDQWNSEVETADGKRGVIASLTNGDGENSIGIRADFDALPIQEGITLP